MLDAVTWLSLPGSSCHLTNFSFFFPVFALGKRAAHRGMRYLPPHARLCPRLQTNPAAKLKQPSKPRAAFPRHEDLGTIPGPPFPGIPGTLRGVRVLLRSRGDVLPLLALGPACP